MKTVSCHRKYSITTNFLDTMLEHSVCIEEGETKLDAYRRGLKELDEIAAELRKEANPHLYPEKEVLMTRFPPQLNGPAEAIPIISKDKERIEIEIDNAESPEELKAVKVKYELMPASLINHFNKRMLELTSGRPKDFTEGLT